MKKSLVAIILAAALACSLVITASASNFEHLADDLNALELFRGTDNGYELDRIPNRIEAVVMLLRLYGLEEEALKCESGPPFTDVSGWQTPYVAYAFENGYTTGTSETTFSPGSPCSAQMYVTFVLRALGYKDGEGGDFTYAEALDYGAGLGIIDSFIAGGDFLRDQMVAVSYLALSAVPKDGEYDCLLEKLVAAGAVPENPAAALMGKWALMSELKYIFGKLISEPGIEMSLIASVDPGPMGAMLAAMGMDLNVSAELDLSVIRDDDIKAAIDAAYTLRGEDSTTQAYLADGVLYTNTNGEKSRRDLAAGEDGEASLLGMLYAADTSRFPLSSYVISDVAKSAEDGLTVYTVEPGDGFVDSVMGMALGMALNAALGDSIPSSLNLEAIAMSMTSLDVKFYADADGILKKCSVDIEMSLGTDLSGVAIKLPVKISCEAEITATGEAVKVVLPDDLGEYKSADEDAA